MAASACGGLAATSVEAPIDPNPVPKNAPSYCEQVEAAVGNANFKCVQPPNGAQVGTWGPIDRPWMNDLATSCFSDAVPPELKDRKVPSAKQGWTRYETSFIAGGASMELSKVLPFLPSKWLPKAAVTANKSATIKYVVSFDDAQIQTLSDIPKALRDRIAVTEAETADKTQRADIHTCVTQLCGGEYTISARAFIATVNVKFDATSSQDFDSSIGWSELATAAHLKMKKNADGSTELSSTAPMVLAVEAPDGKTMMKDLQNGGVCPKENSGVGSLRHSVRQIAADFLESYQCTALRVGVELANSICNSNKAPTCTDVGDLEKPRPIGEERGGRIGAVHRSPVKI